MSSICGNVEPFVDGELAPEKAAVFRQHLPDCASCKRAMTELVQLNYLEVCHKSEDVFTQVIERVLHEMHGRADPKGGLMDKKNRLRPARHLRQRKADGE